VKSFRIISKLDIKDSSIIKGINFEGMRKIGDASTLAKKYFLQGSDELIINDVNASLFSRNTVINFLRASCKEIFIPVTLQGGFRDIENIKIAMRNGADKVSINTGAVLDKKLISKASEKFGNQAIVVTVDVKKVSSNKWEVFVDKGREKTGLNALEWIKFLQKSGAGEIHVNSIDMDGTKRGFDINLIKKINKICKLPVIVGGGLGELKHLNEIVKIKSLDGISVSSVLHYDDLTINKIKKHIKRYLSVRN